MKPELRLAVSSMHYAPMPRRLPLLATALLLGGCIHVSMDPIQVHATLDVNVKVDKALDDFFGDLDKKSTTVANPVTKP
jgi:hypothetical protein